MASRLGNSAGVSCASQSSLSTRRRKGRLIGFFRAWLFAKQYPPKSTTPISHYLPFFGLPKSFLHIEFPGTLLPQEDREYRALIITSGLSLSKRGSQSIFTFSPFSSKAPSRAQVQPGRGQICTITPSLPLSLSPSPLPRPPLRRLAHMYIATPKPSRSRIMQCAD